MSTSTPKVQDLGLERSSPYSNKGTKNRSGSPASKQVIPSSAMTSTGSTSGIQTPPIIGLYGVSGAGKSYLLERLSKTTLSQHLDFVDGSSLIDRRFGLATFRRLSVEEQDTRRTILMSELVEERRKIGKGIVIGGHLMLWNDASKKPYDISVEADWNTYTHIVYYQVDPRVVYERRKSDKSRNRSIVSLDNLHGWQVEERAALRKICYEKRLLFSTITEHEKTPEGKILAQLQSLLTNFLESDETGNLAVVDSALDTILSQQHPTVDTMLVLDADKTLAPQDAGSLFWKFMNGRSGMPTNAVDLILKPQGYSYESFRQVALLYEEVAGDFSYMCNQVAAYIEMYPEMTSLLARIASEPHIGAMVVTCGLRQAWETVLRIAGLRHVKVIGGGTLANKYVVTDTIKGHIVAKLKANSLRVVAFGDSLVDVEMLKNADESFVVVGEKRFRSVSMDSELSKLIDAGFSPRQILLPATVEPRLTEARLPIVQLNGITVNRILRCRFLHATNKASAKLLMTAMRDADVSGHDLRKAHEEVGYYLANEYLSDVLGVESYPMKHVTGISTEGYRFQGEAKTLVVPLMRGGEPMALGVSKALRSASFVHSKTFADIDTRHLEVNETIILVDSVVNSGKSIMEYLVPLRKLFPKVKIVVVAGVVQAGAVENVKDGQFAKALRNDSDITLIALRKSDNKYTGKGATDTGHRLFNTTYLQ